MNADVLMKFGLTKNEASVYYALLELGESKAGRIIRESNFRSGKIYDVLNSLITKGLVAYIDKNKIQYYYPQPPEKIKEYLQHKKDLIESEEKEFNGFLPSLNRIYSEKKDPCDVKVFEGVEGVRSALDVLLDKVPKNSVIKIFGANDDPARDVVLLWRKYEQVCIKLHVMTEVIMSSMTLEGRTMRRNKKNPYKSYRFLAGKDISNFMVGGNIILILDFNKPNCILIDNQTHADQFRELFKVLWNSAQML